MEIHPLQKFKLRHYPKFGRLFVGAPALFVGRAGPLDGGDRPRGGGGGGRQLGRGAWPFDEGAGGEEAQAPAAARRLVATRAPRVGPVRVAGSRGEGWWKTPSRLG